MLAPLALLLALNAAALAPSAAPAGDGWTVLFDGTGVEAFRGFRQKGFPEKGWKVEEGALRKIAGAGGGDLVTREQYRDFELEFEWKVAEGANSGIMYRSTEDLGAPWQTGIEYQILDDAKHPDGRDPRTSAAAFYALIACEGKELAAVGEWNRARIVAHGSRIEHWLNGVQVCSADLASEAWAKLVAASKFKGYERFGKAHHGHIVLQDHGDDVWYRAIRIRRLEPPVAPSGEKLELFDGKSTAGWKGILPGAADPLQAWEIRDGVLVCKGRPIGYLRTERSFTDYVLELEWRFDPEKGAGNSGVLLRIQGEEKVWPRSIEAQLQSERAGDFWNIDAYPMWVEPSRTNGRHTAHTHGNEKPLGEWNLYRITAQGGHVVLSVNGQVLNEAFDCAPLAGPIGLQSEGAEIHFRRVTLHALR
jgi:hypothetical protein